MLNSMECSTYTYRNKGIQTMLNSNAQSIADAYKNKQNQKRGNRMEAPRPIQANVAAEIQTKSSEETKNMDLLINQLFEDLNSDLPEIPEEKQEANGPIEEPAEEGDGVMVSTDMSDIFRPAPIKDPEEPKPSNEKKASHFKKLAPKKKEEKKAIFEDICEERPEESCVGSSKECSFEPDESRFMTIDISDCDYLGVIITNNGKKIKITL